METRESALATAGVGLEGDRYAKGGGSFSSWPGKGRALTLIEGEALGEMEREHGVKLAPDETRRNLVTRGVALNDLIGVRFKVGEVVLRGQRPADPCAYLERLTRSGVLKALMGRGGIRADIEVGGTINVGDCIEILGPMEG
ncbi:MAG: MOSC domain-containing protein [Planctomycetes bacterium]|nr:MOSC domain-containing protein [Planctomycetota bacterium]